MDNSIGIFISYNSQNRFEAATIAQELAKLEFPCWMDFKEIAGGQLWREAIENALRNTMVLIVVLTPETASSQWVFYEIGRAIDDGHVIIPVMFRQCPVPGVLEPYQFIDFTKGPQYEKLFRSIIGGVMGRMRTGHKLPSSDGQTNTVTPAHNHINTADKSHAHNETPIIFTAPKENRTIERPDGTMRAESLFYIERQGDRTLERELAGEGTTIVIKAPRQVGKSSMLVRSIRMSEKLGKKVALLDFQSLDTLSNPELFYQEFCAAISDKLGLENHVEEVWSKTRSNNYATTTYMEKFVLKELNAPLVLGIDEADRLFDCPLRFRSDFFGMLRSWHNSRGMGTIWRNLDLILVISTEPYMLIENGAQSPFNVGEIIELEDFSYSDVENLNGRHGNPFSPQELHKLYELTSGHPYLVRQALYRAAVNDPRPSTILDETNYTTGNGGIFADHLRRYLSYFGEQPYLRQHMIDIIRRQAQLTDDDYHRLHGAGLITMTAAQQLRPRCKLYYLYFGAKLK